MVIFLLTEWTRQGTRLKITDSVACGRIPYGHPVLFCCICLFDLARVFIIISDYSLYCWTSSMWLKWSRTVFIFLTTIYIYNSTLHLKYHHITMMSWQYTEKVMFWGGWSSVDLCHFNHVHFLWNVAKKKNL